jgi:hypothetical protein
MLPGLNFQPGRARRAPEDPHSIAQRALSEGCTQWFCAGEQSTCMRADTPRDVCATGDGVPVGTERRRTRDRAEARLRGRAPHAGPGVAPGSVATVRAQAKESTMYELRRLGEIRGVLS